MAPTRWRRLLKDVNDKIAYMKIIAQYNHPYGDTRFVEWPAGTDSHNFLRPGIWYGHPALVAVWRVRSKFI
jgi:hypothetical protein